MQTFFHDSKLFFILLKPAKITPIFKIDSIDTIENIRKALEERNLGSGHFVNLQKAFSTVDCQILLPNLNH